MKWTQGVLALMASTVLLLPISALADGEPDRLQALEQRMMALEDKLEASEATIEAQRELLKSSAAPAVDDGTGLDGFFSGVNVDGFITASYLYNFNSPQSAVPGRGTSENTFSQTLCQFNCNHDEFSLDAAMLSFGKEASEPGTAGFQLDLLFGQNGDISRALSPTAAGGAFGDSDFGVFVQEAYVAYNWDGVELKFGNWETLLGWELLDSHLNANISHGVLFTWAIPLYHTGLLASGSLTEQVGWSIGITNGFNNVVDQNDNKGVVGILTFEDGPLFTSLSWFLGAETPNFNGAMGAPGTTDDLMIFDFVASYSMDKLSLWMNADYGEQESAFMLSSLTGASIGIPKNSDSDYWGLAAGFNYEISDKLSFALRGEYFSDEDNVRGAGFLGITDAAATTFGAFDGADVEITSLTGTLKYQLTENAYIRGELRWDQVDSDCPVDFGAAATLAGCDGDIFPDDSGNGVDDEAVYGLIEVSYVFD